VIAARTRSATFAIVWRILHNFFTKPSLLLPSILFPLFFFAAFAGGLSTLGKAPGFHYRDGYTGFQFAFVLIQSAAVGGAYTGVAMAADFERGFARRLMLSVPNRLAIIAGYGIGALVRTGFTIALLFAIGLIAGMSVSGNGIDLFGVIGLALIVNAAAALFSSGIALRFRTIQAAPLMQIPVVMILFLAPVYVPVSLLTGWIHAVAVANPFTAILNGARGLLSGTGGRIGLAFAVVIAIAGLLAPFAIRGMRRAEDAGA
jgi:ABC-2 type transport system permease protein